MLLCLLILLIGLTGRSVDDVGEAAAEDEDQQADGANDDHRSFPGGQAAGVAALDQVSSTVADVVVVAVQVRLGETGATAADQAVGDAHAHHWHAASPVFAHSVEESTVAGALVAGAVVQVGSAVSVFLASYC